jgi:hypothetical protein
MARKKKISRADPRRRNPQQVPTWQVIENTVAAIWTVSGAEGKWRVRRNARIESRTGGSRRQVDVFVECPTGNMTFRVGIDVKNEAKPLDIVAVEQLCTKGRGLKLDRYVIVSTSGFYKPALEEAKRRGVHAVRLTTPALKRVFALTHFELHVPRLLSIEVHFPKAAVPPQKDALRRAWIEADVHSTRLADVPASFIERAIQEHPGSTVGRIHELRVEDRSHVWRRLVVDGASYDPPVALRVRWTVDRQQLAGHTYVSDEGNEAFAVILPLQGVMRQLTLVAGPATPDGHSLSLTLGEATPGPIDV